MKDGKLEIREEWKNNDPEVFEALFIELNPRKTIEWADQIVL